MTASELFEKHQSLVGWCYKRYFGDYKSMYLEDIMQEGRLALWECCQKFDESRGFQFSTYAVPFVAGKMRQYFRTKCNVIKLPRKAFEGDLDTYNILTNTASLDASIEVKDDGSTSTLGELIAAPADKHEFITEDTIDTFLSTIKNQRDCDLMEEYYYSAIWGLIQPTQEELGTKYNMSQPQCARLIKKYNALFAEFLENIQT